MMKRRSHRVYLLAAALIFIMSSLTACVPGGGAAMPENTPAQTKGPDTGNKPMAFKSVDSLKPEVYESLSGFSVDLFRRMNAEDSSSNIFLSPLSVWLALGMTYNGASGGTAESMAQALHVTDLPIGDLNSDNAGLMGILRAADPNVQIAIVNSIWVRDSFASAVNEDFLSANKKHYDAAIEALDFSKDDAAGIISDWVEDNTNGNIKDMIEPPIDPLTVMFLINAVHFKAPWKQAFDPKDSRDGVFATSDGEEVQVKYLFRKEGNFGYMDDTVTAVRLPYSNGRLEMVAVLPQRQALGEYIEELTPEKLAEIITKCGETSLALLFPKFKLEYEAELNDVLKAMGMAEAFDPVSADFSALSEQFGTELYISKVRHKSFIEVNEEGTEASAATSVEINRESAPMRMEFNKPFLFLIRDSKTGAILFIGTVADPS